MSEEAASEMKALDAIGQEIKVGDTVVWGAGGRTTFGVGLGQVTELIPRKVFDEWIEEPTYEEVEVSYTSGNLARTYKTRKATSPGVKREITRAYVKVSVDPRLKGGRQGKTRSDYEFIKVVV